MIQVGAIQLSLYLVLWPALSGKCILTCFLFLLNFSEKFPDAVLTPEQWVKSTCVESWMMG